MKNPNGYGCIKRLSGNRRRPYIFVITEVGKQRVIGAFPTQIEALIFQTDYNRSHGLPRLSDNKLTFAELYHRWLPAHIEHASPSMSTLAGYLFFFPLGCHFPIAHAWKVPGGLPSAFRLSQQTHEKEVNDEIAPLTRTVSGKSLEISEI